MSSPSPSKTSAGTFYLIVTQVISRGLTFIGNQALLRYVTPSDLGLAVQFEALSVTVLYTARESLRVALQRTPRVSTRTDGGSDARLQSQIAVNASYMAVTLGLLLGMILSSFYLYPVNKWADTDTDRVRAFYLYCGATMFELLSEPGFVVIQQHALFKERARAETIGAIARTVTGFVTAVWMRKCRKPSSVLPFAIGQFCYGLGMLVSYIWSAKAVASAQDFSLLPRNLSNSSDALLSRFSKPLLSLAGAFYGQSIFKWLLTQGDTLVISLFADLKSQGIFALASNFGGLASRLLFQPVEESSRNVFGRLLVPAATKPVPPDKSAGQTTVSLDQRRQALTYLSATIRVYVLFVVIPCTTLLPELFPLLVQTLLGAKSQWTSPQTSRLLAVYSYYIPCLAINGILDAFVTSVATEVELAAQSLMMLGTSMIYLSAAYLNMNVFLLSEVGLVYANILTMLLRIAFSVWYVKSWIEQNMPAIALGKSRSYFKQILTASIPSTSVLFTQVPVVVAMHSKEYARTIFESNSQLGRLRFGPLDVNLFDLGYTASAAVVLISSILLNERHFILDTVEPLLPKRVKSILQPILAADTKEISGTERHAKQLDDLLLVHQQEDIDG